LLFNSYQFLLLFLPITLVGYFAIGKHSRPLGLTWLALCSLFFYAWWDWRYLGLLSVSILLNFWFGRRIATASQTRKSVWLTVAIGLNLILLTYYKYADLFIATANQSFGTNVGLLHVVLPLGISFFTFTQIAYLVDVYGGKANETKFIPYVLFVTYFPHLIAGPVLHHAQMMPQFLKSHIFKPRVWLFVVGLSIFVIGLSKKVLIADNLAPTVSGIFDAKVAPDFLAAWEGILAYSVQLYFDFSGYSDMAIGISLIFGIRLPVNFYSPYKAKNIAQFWRRWHITLSNFLRDYLYIALGGNRKGVVRRYTNLLITMLLGGLWHGAGWNFLLWGGLHGLYLCIHQLWQTSAFGRGPVRIPGWLAWLITFLAVCVGWIFFRSPSFESSIQILSGAFGLNGLSIPRFISNFSPALFQGFLDMGATALSVDRPIVKAWSFIILGGIICLGFPNTTELFRSVKHSLYDGEAKTNNPGLRFRWKLTWPVALALGVGFTASFLSLSRPTEFLYFQF
jgi:alginate O-acetyltransferase complex protein AlgI